MKKTNRRIALAVVLTLCITLLAGTITARASVSDDIGVCWWQKNKAHEGAEAARALGCTDEYVLKWFGNKWTEANNKQKALEAEKPKLELWQNCQITAYEWDGSRCANGNYPTTGYTVACNSLPLGTKVYIEGIGYRTVEDRGASWHQYNWMDEYLGDVSACNEFGVQWHDVYLVK